MQEIVVGVLANILRTYAIYRFMELSNVSKPVSWRLRLLVYSTFVILTSGGYYLLHSQIINLLTNLTGFAFIILIYKGSLKRRVIFGIGIYAINVIIESFVFSVTGLHKEYDELTRSIRECFTSLGILFSVFFLERVGFKPERKSFIKTSVWIMMLCVPVFSIVEIFCMWQVNYNNNQYISVEIAGVLIINISIFYLYDALQDYYMQRSEKEQFRIAMEGYRNQINTMRESWERLRSLRHDLKLHVRELRYLTMQHEPEKVVAYLNDMEQQLVNEDEFVSSGIQEIDSTLNYLLQDARKNLKEVKIKVALQEDLEIHGFTLNVILGNLLNNAIYAAKQSTEKYLCISIWEKQGVLYIKIENSYSGVLDFRDKKLLSTKANSEVHGIGLANVKKIIREQEGELNISWDESHFYVKAVLFIEKLRLHNE